MATLSERMEFGRVIEVHSDGTVANWDEFGPEIVYVTLDENGYMTERDDKGGAIVTGLPDGWSLMHGYTGQHGSGGAAVIMHPSEYIGGRLERDILANPGLYVAVVVDGLLPAEPDENPNVGWAVAFKETAASLYAY